MEPNNTTSTDAVVAPTSSPRVPVAALIAVLLLLLSVIGWVSYRFDAQLMKQAQDNREDMAKLTKTLSGLSARIEALEARPTPDLEGLNATRDAVTNTKAALEEMTTRLSTVEKQQAETATLAADAKKVAQTSNTSPGADGDAIRHLIAAIEAGTDYTAALDRVEKATSFLPDHPILKAHVSSGIPTELSLRQELVTRVTTALKPEQTVAADGFMGRLNQRLAGLIKIRKQLPETKELLAIRDQAYNLSLGELAALVTALPHNQTASFAEWVEAQQLNHSAHAELDALRAAANQTMGGQ